MQLIALHRLKKHQRSRPKTPNPVQITAPPFSGDWCERVARGLAQHWPDLDVRISTRKTLLRQVETTVHAVGPIDSVTSFNDALKEVLRESYAIGGPE